MPVERVGGAATGEGFAGMLEGEAPPLPRASGQESCARGGWEALKGSWRLSTGRRWP